MRNIFAAPCPFSSLWCARNRYWRVIHYLGHRVRNLGVRFGFRADMLLMSKVSKTVRPKDPKSFAALKTQVSFSACCTKPTFIACAQDYLIRRLIRGNGDSK